MLCLVINRHSCCTVLPRLSAAMIDISLFIRISSFLPNSSFLLQRFFQVLFVREELFYSGLCDFRRGTNSNKKSKRSSNFTNKQHVQSFSRPYVGEDRAELKQSERTQKYINCGGFLEAVSHFGSWPMGEFVDATRMHILATRNHRGSSRRP